MDTIADPLDPAYQRGFVAGANAVLIDVSVLAPEVYQKILDEARASGYIA